MELPPFLSLLPMQGDPPCGWSDFLTPQLRRFPLAHTSFQLREPLGHGIEGCVARVTFGDDEFAIKIFFSSFAEGRWWPLEREARTVAVLEKVQSGLRQTAPKPIHVPAKRISRLDCLRCLYAFSTDGRSSRAFDELPADQTVAISDSFTRIRKCFGWIRVHGADFTAMNNIITIDRRAAEKGEGTASYIEPDQEYFAILYEYLPSAKLELKAVQRQLDFFHHIGFQPCQGADKRNWQGPGVLLDFGDYTSPTDRWFGARSAYYPCLSAEDILDPRKGIMDADREWNRKEELREQGVGPTEEEQQAEQEENSQEDTAMYVERGYKGWHTSYFDLNAEERRELKLKEDPLAHIRIREIKPKAVRKAWRAYEKHKKLYLAPVADAGAPMSDQTPKN